MDREKENAARRKYRKKCKFLNIMYSSDEIYEYDRIRRYLAEYNLPVSAFMKNLIEKYLDHEEFE